MVKIFLAFASLYFAILLLSLGTGLYNTYMALSLTQEGVGQAWVGLLMSAYYFGLVIGVKLGHLLILQFGHIRAYAASAALVAVMVLAQTLVSYMPLWLGFRVVVGIAMVTQYMVLESWLNDQAEADKRGVVFSFYMVMSSLGIVLGQLAITAFPSLDTSALNAVAIAVSLCLIPIALTRRPHPVLKSQAPLNIKVYLKLVPNSLITLFLGGMITSSFYALGAVYAAKQGYSPAQVSIFLSVCVMAGLLSQWPMGYLSDRLNRLKMLRVNAFILFFLTLPLILLTNIPLTWLLVAVALIGSLQFTFYPLAVASANEHVGPALRVGLSGAVLLAFSVGAALGPIIAGQLMDAGGSKMFYVYTASCAIVLALILSRPRSAKKPKVVDEPFVPMGIDVQPAPVVRELDPRVDLKDDISADPEALHHVAEMLAEDKDGPVIMPNMLVDEEDFAWSTPPSELELRDQVTSGPEESSVEVATQSSSEAQPESSGGSRPTANVELSSPSERVKSPQDKT